MYFLLNSYDWVKIHPDYLTNTFSFLGGYGCINWRYKWRMHSINQALHFCSTLPTSKIVMFVSPACVNPGCFFRWRMESSWEAQGQSGWVGVTTWAPKQGWLVFLLRDLFCKHGLDSLRKNLISWKKSDEIRWNISFMPKMTFIDV